MDKKCHLKDIFLPSVADLFFVTVLLTLFFQRKSGLLADGDTGYHIRAGEHIIRTGSIPHYDIFSLHAPPLPWIAHEWLSEVLMAAAHRTFGLSGVVAGAALILAATMALLFRVLRRERADILPPIAITLLALLSSQLHWLARPHLFSLLFMVLFHYLIDAWHTGRANRLYLLPPLMLLWVNLHGGYVGGFLILAAYLAGDLSKAFRLSPEERREKLRRLRELAVAGAACLAACLVNPYGYEILLFPFRLVADGYLMDNVNEFLSPDFHQWLPFKYLLLLLVAQLAISRKRIEPSELLLVIVFTYMALYSARYIPLFALVTAPILSGRWQLGGGSGKGRFARFIGERSLGLAEIDFRARWHLFPVAAVVAVAWGLFSGEVSHAFDADKKPVAACEFLLREEIDGNMLNNDEFGDYVIYRCYPRYRVFIDGRLDMYGSERLKEFNRVLAFEPGWRSILEKYRITWMLMESESRFVRYLLKDPDWTQIYSDGVARIFVKNIPEHRDLVARYGSSAAGTAN